MEEELKYGVQILTLDVTAKHCQHGGLIEPHFCTLPNPVLFAHAL